MTPIALTEPRHDRRPARAAALAIVLAIALAGGASAQEVDPGEGPFVLTADRLDYDTERSVAIAEGDVEISRGTRRLLADKVIYDEARDRVTAEGNVVLVEPTGEVLFADRATISGDLREGTVDRLGMLLTDDSRATAHSGERRDGNITEMRNVTYSPCRLCPGGGAPLWQIRSGKVTHNQESHHITHRNAFLDFFGVPVLYTPYLRHPDPTVKRQSGFLAPAFRSSGELGLGLDVPYFINLAPNRDITLTPIFTTNAGQVLAGEYRALPSERGDYRLAGSMVNDPRSDEGNDEGGFRGFLEGDGEFDIDAERRWGFDGEVASDKNYLRSYDFSRASVLTSRLFTERITRRGFYGLNAYGFQGLRNSDDQDLIPYAVPLATFEHTTLPLAFGTLFETSGNVLALTRTGGRNTRRVSGDAALVLPRIGPAGDVYRFRAGLRGDVYQYQGSPQDVDVSSGSSSEGRVLPQLSMEWSWPLIADAGRYSPTIEPIATLAWNPRGGNSDDIANEDSVDFELDMTNILRPDRLPGLDRVEEGLRASYGVRFGVAGPQGGEFAAAFGQSYSFADEDAFDRQEGVGDEFSDYVGRLDLAPAEWLAASYRFRLDRDDLGPKRQELGLDVGPRRARFSVDYLSLSQEREDTGFGRREELTVGTRLGITPWLAVSASSRRDLEDDRWIENGVGLVYTNYCLILAVGVERSVRNSSDGDDNTTVGVRLTLRNLGEVGGGI